MRIWVGGCVTRAFRGFEVRHRSDLFLSFARGCGDSTPAVGPANLRLANGAQCPYQQAMILRAFSAVLAVILLAGCPMSDKRQGKAKGKGKDPYHTDTPPIPTKDESGDVAFQAFVGRLRIAVRKRDLAVLAPMMAEDFGYRWDDPPEGETPFLFWDRNNLWGELASLLKENWVPYDGFMVVPPQFAVSPDFRGYRAGLKMVNGSWKFAYFVPPPPTDQ